LTDYQEVTESSGLITDPNETDTDGDQLTDSEEVNGAFGFVSDPRLPDTDKDGLSDLEELKNTPAIHGYHPNPAEEDTDGDGLTDLEEISELNGYISDPTMVDTDGDGLSDFEEIRQIGELLGRDLIAGLSEYFGDDIVTDPRDSDTDNDGIPDAEEVREHKTNPKKADTDNDGLTDSQEINKCNTSPVNPDTDGDRVADADECSLVDFNLLLVLAGGGTLVGLITLAFGYHWRVGVTPRRRVKVTSRKAESELRGRLLDEAEISIAAMARGTDGFLKPDEIMATTGISEEDVDLVLLKRLGARRSGDYYVVPEAMYRNV